MIISKHCNDYSQESTNFWHIYIFYNCKVKEKNNIFADVDLKKCNYYTKNPVTGTATG
jgi:hypothetical protein